MRKGVKKLYTSATHEENKKRVCLLCLRSNKSLIPIKGKLKYKIESIVSFKINETAPTTVICNSCYRKLYRNKSDESNFVLPDYSKFIFRNTRSNSDENQCSCYLCTLIRSRKNNENKKKKHIIKNFVENRCKKCFSVIARGISHYCKKGKYKNVKELVQHNLDGKQKDHVVASLLKDKTVVNNVDGIQNNVVLLSQDKGKPLKLVIRPKEKNNNEANLISVNEVAEMQNNFNFSSKTTKGVLSSVRKMVGKRKVFEPNIMDKLKEHNHSVDSYFSVEKYDFTYLKAKKKVPLLNMLCTVIMSKV